MKREANERKSVQHFWHLKTRFCVKKSSRDVSECQASAEIGLGACPQITCSAETLLRSGVCLR